MPIESERIIDADVQRVWDLTADVEAWPSLTPTMTSVTRLDDGPFGVGSQARVVQPGQRPTTWTVTRFEPPLAFEWEAKVLTVTMTGTHHLSTAGSGTRNVLGLRLSGPGHRLIGRLVGAKVQQAIDTENDGFKAAAESTEAPTS